MGKKTIEESYLLLGIRMSCAISIITSALCGFFCFSGCIFCRDNYKSSREPEEETRSFSIVRNTQKEIPLLVDTDLVSANIECSICLEGYEVGQELVILNCMHFYHENCLSAWNKDHLECPQCRENIKVVFID